MVFKLTVEGWVLVDNLSFVSAPRGMLDWMTLRLDASLLPENIRQVLKENTARILKIDKDGNLEWESAARESISSDSHQITIKFGSTLEIMGSPARVIRGNNVFGSLSIRRCFKDMVLFVQRHFGIMFPLKIEQWKCTRIDITRNYAMGDYQSVLQAIDALKMVNVGRQKATHYDTTIMWGKGSSLHNGKAYAKGPDLKRNVNKKKAFCTEEELEKAYQLLRLEYSLRRHMIERYFDTGLKWYDYSEAFLIELHDRYFSQFISEIEVVDMDNVLELLLKNVGDGKNQVPTERQAHNAYDCYMRCKTMGKQVAKGTYRSTRTWFHHLKNLKNSGIYEVDLQPNNVVPLKRRQIVLSEPVSCWDDIKLVEGM